MTRATYIDVPDHLTHGTPFQGNSLSAAWEAGDYVVRSYGTEIARRTDGRVILNRRRYSRTTSRGQNLCHAFLPGHRFARLPVTETF